MRQHRKPGSSDTRPFWQRELPFLLFLLLLAWFAGSTSFAESHTISADAVPDSTRFLNTWPPEYGDGLPLRWTRENSAILLHGYGDTATVLVRLYMSAPLLERGAGSPITLVSDEVPTGQFALVRGWRLYHVLANADGATWDTARLKLQMPTNRGIGSDRRLLGATLSRVTLHPTTQLLPLALLWRAFAIMGLGLLVRGWIGVLTPQRSWLAPLSGLLASVVLLGLAWRSPAVFEMLLPLSFQIVLAGVSLAVLMLVARGSPRAAMLLLQGILAVVLVSLAGGSIPWRPGHDLANAHYIGVQLAEHGIIPYRDLFTQNAPGTYLIHAMLSLLVGSSTTGLRLADLGLLAVVLASIYTFTRTALPTAALFAALLFGLVYLGYGPPMGLQREFLVVVAVALGCALVPNLHYPAMVVAAWAGLWFGVAATIKPHALLGFPIVLLTLVLTKAQHHHPIAQSSSRTIFAVQSFKITVAGGFSMLIAIIGTGGFVILNGALPAFLDIARNYWPLYGELSSVHVIVPVAERPAYLISTFASTITQHIAFLPALVGAALAYRWGNLAAEQRRLYWFVWAMAGVYTIYPIFAGKFWYYHWLPAVFWYTLLASLCLIPITSSASSRAGWLRRMLPLGLLLITLTWQLTIPRAWSDLVLQRQAITQDGAMTPRSLRIDRMTAFLQAELRPGDTVQALDWTGGASEAMMRANASSATRFLEDFYWYHHIDTPYIQALRQQFLREFDQARPRVVLDVYGEYKPWVSGPRTTRSFPELQQRLDADYRVVLEGEGYRVYERRDTGTR